MCNFHHMWSVRSMFQFVQPMKNHFLPTSKWNETRSNRCCFVIALHSVRRPILTHVEEVSRQSRGRGLVSHRSLVWLHNIVHGSHSNRDTSEHTESPATVWCLSLVPPVPCLHRRFRQSAHWARRQLPLSCSSMVVTTSSVSITSVSMALV